MSEAIFERYLTDDQKAEIAAEEFRAMCRGYFEKNKDNSISNVAYHMVWEEVDKALDGTAETQIKDAALKVISELSSYSVFRAPDVWERKASPAWELLMQIVIENRDLLEKAVQHHAHNLSKSDILDIIKSAKLTIETGQK